MKERSLARKCWIIHRKMTPVGSSISPRLMEHLLRQSHCADQDLEMELHQDRKTELDGQEGKRAVLINIFVENSPLALHHQVFGKEYLWSASSGVTQCISPPATTSTILEKRPQGSKREGTGFRKTTGKNISELPFTRLQGLGSRCK